MTAGQHIIPPGDRQRDFVIRGGTAFLHNHADPWDDWTYNERNEQTAPERFERGRGYPRPTKQPIAADDFEYAHENTEERVNRWLYLISLFDK